MNPDKQRIAIAEACGWKCFRTLDGIHWYPPDLPQAANAMCHTLPDYLNDLNAMAGAENALMEPPMVRDYVTYLCTICEHAKPMVPVWHASAAQRAEAFLRTIGKWEDA